VQTGSDLCTQSFVCEYSKAKEGEESKTGRLTGRLEEKKKSEKRKTIPVNRPWRPIGLFEV
jgi:hypothetical protein